MRGCLLMICASLLTSVAFSQQPPATSKTVDDKPAAAAASSLDAMFESKIKAEWEAIKNKDKKAYGDMLADDYQGVENDGLGERNKLQAINELLATNVFNYTLWGMKVTPLGPDTAFVVYESTMQFPPKSQLRYSRIYIGELWVKHGEQWKILHYQETHVK
jgi:hypothetical protein